LLLLTLSGINRNNQLVNFRTSDGPGMMMTIIHTKEEKWYEMNSIKTTTTNILDEYLSYLSKKCQNFLVETETDNSIDIRGSFTENGMISWGSEKWPGYNQKYIESQLILEKDVIDYALKKISRVRK